MLPGEYKPLNLFYNHCSLWPELVGKEQLVKPIGRKTVEGCINLGAYQFSHVVECSQN